MDAGAPLLAELTRRAAGSDFPATTNPCGEITLHVTGGYCVIADFAPLLACPVPLKDVIPGAPDPETARVWDARVEDAVRLGVRFLMRANTMDSLYAEEVARTNRMGIGPTGLHEYAWMRFGLAFHDLLDEEKSAPFWEMLDRLSRAAKQEGGAYAERTRAAPAGDGDHGEALRHHQQAVRPDRGRAPAGAARNTCAGCSSRAPATRSPSEWLPGSDPLLADYAARGYPLRELKTFPGITIVGFPTVPLIMRLGLAGRLVTAPEASPEQQYHWLRLLERHWIGAEQGNQVSYTLKLYTDRHDLDGFRAIVLREQPEVRCCAILPTRPDHALGYEYLPEEDMPADAFSALVAVIDAAEAREAVDMVHLQCASGVCPI